MGNRRRCYLPGATFEITTRTIQQRYLLRPSQEANELILGVIGKAQAFYSSVLIHAFVFLSNHYHMMATCTDGREFALFIQYVNANIAKRLNSLHNWEGSLWGHPVSVIPILDDAAMLDRLRYLLENGVKEGLVSSPRDWPGASSITGFLSDMKIDTTWLDLDYRRRATANEKSRDRFDRTFTITLSPIPVWAHLPSDQLQANHEKLVRAVEQCAHPNPVGADKLLRANPHDRPDNPKRSPQPLCHASTPKRQAGFRKIYRRFADAFRRGAALLHGAPPSALAAMPAGSFFRPSWFRNADAPNAFQQMLAEIDLASSLDSG